MESKDRAIHKFLENIVINKCELSIICGARVMKIIGENLYVLRKSTTSILCISTLIPPNPKSASYQIIIILHIINKKFFLIKLKFNN